MELGAWHLCRCELKRCDWKEAKNNPQQPRAPSSREGNLDMTLMPCQIVQAQVLHEDTGAATEAMGMPVMVTEAWELLLRTALASLRQMNANHKAARTIAFTQKAMQLLAITFSL